MLRAQRRLLRRSGRLACLVIEVAPRLDRAGRRRAARCGPPHVATSSSYASLLRSAGFGMVDAIDLTEDYRETAAAWRRERLARADEYRSVVGEAVFADRMSAGVTAVRAIEQGLLRRTLYLASRR